MRSPERLPVIAVLLAAGLLVLVPWMEAGGEARPAIWLDVIAQVLALAVVAGWWLGSGRRLAPRWGLALLPYATVLAAAAMVSSYPYAAVVSANRILTAALLAVALGATLSASSRRLLVWGWLVAATPAAVAALAQVVAGGGRGRAGFVNPNHLGGFLLLALPLAASAAAAAADRRRRLLAHGLILLLGAGVMASGSRAALAGLLALAAIGLWSQAGRLWHGSRRRLVLAAAALAVLTLFSGASLVWRFAGPTDTYRYDRLRIWPQALSMAAAAPLLGIGPGQFRHQSAAHNFPRLNEPVRYGRVFRSPHSHPLLVLAETGVAGLAALLLAVGWLWATHRKTLRASSAVPAEAGLMRAAGAGLLLLGAISLVDEPLAHPPMLMAGAVLLALALPAGRGRELPRPRLMRGFAALLLAVPAVALGVMPGAAQHAAVRAAAEIHPARRAALLQEAARLNPWQPFYAGDEAALLLTYARRPLDLRSYARIRTLCDRAVAGAPGEAEFRITRARLERRACVELLRDEASCGRAAADYAAAVDLQPRDARIRRELASFAALREEGETAVASLRAAVDLEPAYVGAWTDLVSLLDATAAGSTQERRRLEEARRVASAAVAESAYARDILALDGPAADLAMAGER